MSFFFFHFKWLSRLTCSKGKIGKSCWWAETLFGVKAAAGENVGVCSRASRRKHSGKTWLFVSDALETRRRQTCLWHCKPQPTTGKAGAAEVACSFSCSSWRRVRGTPSAWLFQAKDPASLLPASALQASRAARCAGHIEASSLTGEENHSRGLIEREIHLQTQDTKWKPANKRCQLEAGQTDTAEKKLKVKCFGCWRLGVQRGAHGNSQPPSPHKEALGKHKPFCRTALSQAEFPKGMVQTNV